VRASKRPRGTSNGSTDRLDLYIDTALELAHRSGVLPPPALPYAAFAPAQADSDHDSTYSDPSLSTDETAPKRMRPSTSTAGVLPPWAGHFPSSLPASWAVSTSVPHGAWGAQYFPPPIPPVVGSRRWSSDEEESLDAPKSVAPNGQPWVKGRMSPEERARVDQFMVDVGTGVLRVRKGDLARQLRECVNPLRPPEFFEKLVSRRQMNKRFDGILGPKAARRMTRSIESGSPPGLASPMASFPIASE
jgi:hypothetical protein